MAQSNSGNSDGFISISLKLEQHSETTQQKKWGKHSYLMISKCQSMELICYYILHQRAFILWYFALDLPLSWLSNLPIRVQPLLYVTAKALYDDKSASNSATRFSLSIARRTNTTFTLIDSFSKSKSLCQGRWHRMPECE